MDDLVRAVDAAVDEEEDAVVGGGAVVLEGPRADDEVGGAGLVQEGGTECFEGGVQIRRSLALLLDPDGRLSKSPCVHRGYGRSREAIRVHESSIDQTVS